MFNKRNKSIFIHYLWNISPHENTRHQYIKDLKTHQMFLKYCNLLAFPGYKPEPFYTTVNVREKIFKTITDNKHQSQMLRRQED